MHHVAVIYQHCEEDEHLLRAALDAGPLDGHMMIFDARSFSAAAGNKFMVRSVVQ